MSFCDSKEQRRFEIGGILRGEVANVLGCDIVINEFELKLINCVHFLTNTLGKVMNSHSPSAMG